MYSLKSSECSFHFSVHEDVKFGGNLDQLGTRIIIHHTGRNLWLTPIILKSKCRVNVKYYPFDTQECHLKFGSWTYPTQLLNVTDGNISISKYRAIRYT